MAEGWSFPSNNYGQISGIGEAGIETFRGTPFRSLAREICQNSLDARSSTDRPVRVEFARAEVESVALPGFSELRAAIASCYEFWEQQGNDKTVKFFARAKKVAARQKIPVLRISDYNTTGLTGSDREYNTPWQNLVKAAGVSGKSGDSGGSFGIGKSAPFACSDLRTVFYATRDEEGREAFQGIARLVSFAGEHGITTGTGYYGRVERNRALPECRSLVPGFRRRAVGTDVFVVGLTERREWEREVVAALLDDFLIAIYEGALEVAVGSVTITAATLPQVVEEYHESAKTAYNYYQALTSEAAYHSREDFARLGDIEIFMLIGSGLHRRVLMSRGSGMKIFDQKNFPSAIPFAGICILRGRDINAYFRELENPQHDAWEPERGTKPAEAKRRKLELFRHLKELVLELGRTTPIDEADAEGVGEYLPDDVPAQPSAATQETIEDDTKKVEVALKPVVAGANGFSPLDLGQKGAGAGEETDAAPGELDLFATGEDGTAGGDAAASDDNAGPDGPAANGAGAGSGANDSKGANSAAAAARPRATVPLPSQSVRLILVDARAGRYRLNFLPLADAREATLTLKIAGEQGGRPVSIRSAKMLSTREELPCDRNTITLRHLRARSRASVEFTIGSARSCSMEVNLYGHTL